MWINRNAREQEEGCTFVDRTTEALIIKFTTQTTFIILDLIAFSRQPLPTTSWVFILISSVLSVIVHYKSKYSPCQQVLGLLSAFSCNLYQVAFLPDDELNRIWFKSTARKIKRLLWLTYLLEIFSRRIFPRTLPLLVGHSRWAAFCM